MRLNLVGLCLAFGICGGATESTAAPASGCDLISGTWEYAPPSLPGRAIVSKQASGTYLAVWIGTAPDKGTTPAGAWEATCEGAKVRWRILFSTDPASVGQELTMDWEAAGDTVRYWFLGADGKRGDVVVVHRLK